MRDDFRGLKVILGVDRLDCIKGIPQKLHAFDALLEQRPQFVGQVTLLQVVVPSRDDLKAHQDLKEEIHQLVGKINGKFGTFPHRTFNFRGGVDLKQTYLCNAPLPKYVSNTRIGKINYVPVQFVYACVDPDELTALYFAADICFVSSTRDGMNLVCSEFIACHSDKAAQLSRKTTAFGSLVLSKFAGAAEHMDGAFIVNPWDKGSCANALAYALNMGAAEASIRMKKLNEKVEQQTR